MAPSTPPVKSRRILSRLFSSSTGAASAAEARDEASLVGPIRGELMGAERLADHARKVARRQRLAPDETKQPRRRRPPLLERLDGTQAILEDARARLSAAADREVDVSPAGDWLLDNFFVVQEQLREIRESMPKGYLRELPKLLGGPLAGYPRVYEIAIELIAHTEGRLNLENVSLFVGEFQAMAPLRLGELWAVPTMIRLGLIENVRRMALRTVARLDEVEEADRRAERLRVAFAAGDERMSAELNAFVANPPALTPAFVTRFLQQIRLNQANFAPLVWLEQWIAEDGMSAEDAVAKSNQRLALTQVMMANSITSLRALTRLDWPEFVERQSTMERVLRTDPTGQYALMTFGTRDHYRHVIEHIARRSKRSELEVAKATIDLAANAKREAERARDDRPADRRGVDGVASDMRRAHVGYWLVDEGRAELERQMVYDMGPREALVRWAMQHPNAVYFGALSLGTLLAVMAAEWVVEPKGRGEWWAVALAVLVAASEVAIGVVNQLVTFFMPPRTLPKLEMREDGIPDEFRTAVVVPTLFGSVEGVREALEHLEVQFLANRDPNLRFAVLSDFTDAATETKDGDQAILDEAVQGITALNAQYASTAGVSMFYLLHRGRQWNKGQGVWMGWERKRGKLAQFNQLLRGGAEGAFTTAVGDLAALRSIRYVITLDSDTVLPPDAARLMVGTLAHPLNRAVFDEQFGRIVRGYGILQPRVGVSLPSAFRSRFAAIHSGHPGVDPYTTAVSDVYQDLFGEGSFTGKGIYDVDAFERATHARFPENTLLSHDLIEGNYARAGLATDVEVYDDYPTRYLTFTRRKHRWIRGDWQLLRWLGRTVPGKEGAEPNRLSFVSRWKLFDNLRRSVVEISLVVMLVLGWTVMPGRPLEWTGLALGAIAFPWMFGLLLACVRPPRDKSWLAYYRAIGRDARTSVQQIGLAVTFLAHQAWVSGDAIVRTLHRLLISRCNLLEWQTASQTERAMSTTSRDAWRKMGPAVALAVAIVLIVLAVPLARLMGWIPLPREATAYYMIGTWRSLGAHMLAWVPLVAAWISAPAVAHALSAPVVQRELRLSAAERAQSLRYALLHWRFFDVFVTSTTNGLAPDNFQEDPQPIVAPRTSPTNIGLQLLSIASAYELGFITLGDMVDRAERVFRSLERMRRFKGHFYNWYATDDLRVLEPRYVSTVDSGNLAGHLLAFRQAALAAERDRLVDSRLWRALDAALGLAYERVRELATSGAAESPAQFDAIAVTGEAVRAARRVVRDAPPPAAQAALEKAETAVKAARVQLAKAKLAAEHQAPADEWLAWCAALLSRHRSELTALGPSLGGADVGAAPRLTEAADASADVSGTAREERTRLEVLAQRAGEFAMQMDFKFLFDERRKLFAIGFHEASAELDASFYDLLASECRLTSFFAIAKGDVPVEHWFRLGRSLTRESDGTALVSWSGSMFEYLMPLLVMRSYPETLLDQTYKGAVKIQQIYGAQRGVPWGVSESAYNVRDRALTYQYRAFGVPDLALKRGLAKDLVVAPYASAMAVMVEPHEALRNLTVLERDGALGAYGFRDAIDYTRPDAGGKRAVVGSYFAHHIGMGLVALTNVLTRHLWQRRFHADRLVKSAELLMYERIPRRLVLSEPREHSADDLMPEADIERPAVREIVTPYTPQPRVALLGDSRFNVMITNGGGGYTMAGPVAVTRWRADGTRDAWGQWCYVKDLGTARGWSASFQPTCVQPDWYRATLSAAHATFHRRDGDVETFYEVAVVPDDGAEVRRVTVVNHGSTAREIEVTSYGEVVLTDPNTDRAHPAFANLFVQTEWLPQHAAVVATRRPRAASEKVYWAAHVAATGPELIGEVSCETSRERFVGRTRTTRDPAALGTDGPLSGTAGAVLDPVFSLRARVHVEPGQSARVAFTTLVSDDHARVVELADRYHDVHNAQRALDLAWTASQVELRELGVTPADAAQYQQFAGHLFFAHPGLRAPQSELVAAAGGQPALWSQGISGDWPIVLATIDGASGMPTIRQLLAAHQYWRVKGVTVDLVILNTHPPTYLQELADQLMTTVLASTESAIIDRPGGVFVRRADVMPATDLAMLRAVARVHVVCDGLGLGRLMEVEEELGLAVEEGESFGTLPGGWGAPPQFHVGSRLPNQRNRPISAMVVPTPAVTPAVAPAAVSTVDALAVDAAPAPAIASPAHASAVGGVLPHHLMPFTSGNRLGALTPDLDYEIRVGGGHTTPAPWANVVANPAAGFCVTESGGGFAWAENSFFFRLTPWTNDPVSDPVTEALYLRDEISGEVWCPTPAPRHDGGAYAVRHGAGHSTFTHERGGIATELSLGMAGADAVKVSRLRVTNRGGARRELSVTSFVEWCLGVQREQTQHLVRTRFDRELGAVLAENSFDPQFAGLVAFSRMSEPVTDFTADRREFLGRHGSTAVPAAMVRTRLSGTTGAGIDPCAALRCALTLEAGETREIVMLLGAARGDANARMLAMKYADPRAASAAVDAFTESWDRRLTAIAVKTPDAHFDAMVNRWALYQALACRMWARSALYQSSGAYGFRDQLQDTMAFVYAEPALARDHLLRSARRQFLEGDVQHWWHPQSGRGVRTAFSDDLAWLPFVAEHYVRTTGDAAVLDEYVPFITMRPLGPDEHELYDLPTVTDEHASVYEHCLRALRKACTFGVHDLPLIGIGDWNDGMNRVGVGGKGESVWLAWFLTATLRRFAPICEARGDADQAYHFRLAADRYVKAIETTSWDGDWYRRAYFDDGTPLGSTTSEECKIDSIAQSWSVISGAGSPEHSTRAMQSFNEHLVREDARLLMLLTPSFDHTTHDPGYIKGYLPGVRENGAQYTHAALWAVLATALRGDGDRAFELFQMLNPLTHAETVEGAGIYKVEPYVIAADVYTAEGQLGRGGWTWYTGSASWTYRVALEAILGFTKAGDHFTMNPCLPKAWDGFELTYRVGTTEYHVVVQNPEHVARGVRRVTVDGVECADGRIGLADGSGRREVVVEMGA